MRRRILIVSGILTTAAGVLFAVGLVARPDDHTLVEGTRPNYSTHLRPLPDVAPPPPPPAEPEPQSPFTSQERVILRNLTRVNRGWTPNQRFGELAQWERELDEVGWNSPAAYPAYLRLLNWEPRIEKAQELAILRQVARIPGDRSAFRKPAVDRLNHPDLGVAKVAMQLLLLIATAEDVPAVVERFVTIEYDDRIEPRDHAYFAESLIILAKFGGEAEIAALDKAKAEHLLSNDDKFWAKAEACKKAIRERLAKEKEKTDKK